MGRGILRGAGGDENLKFNFIWPNGEQLAGFTSDSLVEHFTGSPEVEGTSGGFDVTSQSQVL